MKFGVCGNVQQAAAIKAAGYDFIEMPLYPTSCLSDEEFAQVKCTLEEMGLKSLIFNQFFAGDAPILQEDAADTVRPYVRAALARAAALGCQVAVIGSGTARRCPDDMSADVFFERFSKTVRMVIDEAEKWGITIVIEPLRAAETNTINTVAQAIAFADSIQDERLRLHADTYHMSCNGEPMTEILRTKGRLAHLHIARPNIDRGIPREADRPFVEEVAAVLAACDYDGYVSIEAACTDFDSDIKAARPLLQRLAR
ncbi:MAG: sugar phosphate isomerase/epimerase [Clostridia bacterium]|nr:sugar phosphate isomerase/epimerase [Clostridia bacterium]